MVFSQQFVNVFFFLIDGITLDEGMPPRCVYLLDTRDQLEMEHGEAWSWLSWDNVDGVRTTCGAFCGNMESIL